MISIMNNQIHSTIDRYTYALEPIDGDLRKARPVDRTVDFGYPEQLGVEWLRYGRPVERELLPTRLEVVGTDKAVPRRLVELPDLSSSLGAFIVSQAFARSSSVSSLACTSSNPSGSCMQRAKRSHGPSISWWQASVS
jgi:hypothetical protein